MPRFTLPSIHRVIATLLAASLLAAPAMAFDYEQLMKLKKEFEVVRDMVRKLRGREPAPPTPSPPVPAQTPAPGQSPAPGQTPGVGDTPAPVAGGMSFKGNCVGKDETGYVENAQVTVAGGQVTQLAVRIDIPKRGSCRYQLAAFNQTKQTPFVELLAKSNSTCALRMWQQGDRITFAATDCADKCAKGAFEYAWPLEFDATGGCH